MKKIGLVYNATRGKNLEIIEQIEKLLHDKGISTWRGKTAVPDSDWKKLNEPLDFAIVLGGDGTLLGASRALSPKNIPIFGISSGHLGFLTEGKNRDVLDIVQKVLNGEYRVEERAMLQAQIINGASAKLDGGYLVALNDIVISRGTSYKMIHMTLNVDDRPVADYIADGLIISTPTGSTAYALSSGGAVMDPEIRGIEIVPICAHSLINRPHIVADNRTITITFNKPHDGTILQVDGQETFPIKFGTKVKVTRAANNAKLMRLLENNSDFYSVIREKFHWGRTATQ